MRSARITLASASSRVRDDVVAYRRVYDSTSHDSIRVPHTVDVISIAHPSCAWSNAHLAVVVVDDRARHHPRVRDFSHVPMSSRARPRVSRGAR